MQVNKDAAANALSWGSTFTTIGVVLLSLAGLIMLLISISGDVLVIFSGILLNAPFIVPGIFLARAGKKRKRITTLFDKYLGIFHDDLSLSLLNLAALSKTPLIKVRANIQYMIKLKFFPNAYISKENRLMFREDAESYQAAH
ncbi:MAG: hypothetical protein FWD16_01260 [Clostridia bacterium]|nr:hypothetical protein [Clostridia bacterium]